MEFKKRKKKKSEDEAAEPTKEENAVGKYLRWNCPTKSSTMMGNKVDYFVASKAVDCLLDSNWASGKKNTEIIFTDRASVEEYLDKLLTLGFFSRVVKIKKAKGKDKAKEKEKDKTEEGESKKKKKEKKLSDDGELDAEGQLKKEESEAKSSTTSAGPSTSSGVTTTATSSEEGKKKRKVKVKLELHEDQIFLDGDEAYVWIFDPVHPKTLAMGVLVVIATIAICLFPLWPDSVREGVWYISVIAAIGIGVILFLAIFRYFLFAVVWAVTVGRHHFWLLPNLTEECGFFESFKPLYTHELRSKTTDNETTGQKQTAIEQEDSTRKDDEKDTGSEPDKENGESWVKLTEEEVENAKHEAQMEDQQEDQIITEKHESNDDNSVDEVPNTTVTSSDPIC